jgi:hypothetical protein
VIAVGIALGGGIGIGAAIWSGKLATPPITAASKQATSTSYLFSIPAVSGSLIGPNDQQLTLTLAGTRNYLTRFTDRPLREAFVVANVDWQRRFPGYFGDVPPNAVLTYTPPGSSLPVSIVLTIAKPKWNASNNTWTFVATRIRKKTDDLPDTTVHITPPYIANPTSFGHATLFVDDGGEAGGNNCTGYMNNDTNNAVIAVDVDSAWSTDTFAPSAYSGWANPYAYGQTPPANSVATGSSDWYNNWASDGGFDRGCHNSVNWAITYEGQTYNIYTSITDPWTGANTWSCDDSAFPASWDMQCVVDPNTDGDGGNISIYWDLCSNNTTNALGNSTCTDLTSNNNVSSGSD